MKFHGHVILYIPISKHILHSYNSLNIHIQNLIYSNNFGFQGDTSDERASRVGMNSFIGNCCYVWVLGGSLANRYQNRKRHDCRVPPDYAPGIGPQETASITRRVIYGQYPRACLWLFQWNYDGCNRTRPYVLNITRSGKRCIFRGVARTSSPSNAGITRANLISEDCTN